jgi:hypothetical protein
LLATASRSAYIARVEQAARRLSGSETSSRAGDTGPDCFFARRHRRKTNPKTGGDNRLARKPVKRTKLTHVR